LYSTRFQYEKFNKNDKSKFENHLISKYLTQITFGP
jgi:hypothetical protein